MLQDGDSNNSDGNGCGIKRNMNYVCALSNV